MLFSSRVGRTSSDENIVDSKDRKCTVDEGKKQRKVWPELLRLFIFEKLAKYLYKENATMKATSEVHVLVWNTCSQCAHTFEGAERHIPCTVEQRTQYAACDRKSQQHPYAIWRTQIVALLVDERCVATEDARPEDGVRAVQLTQSLFCHIPGSFMRTARRMMWLTGPVQPESSVTWTSSC